MNDQPCPCCGHDPVAVDMVFKEDAEEIQALKDKLKTAETEVEKERLRNIRYANALIKRARYRRMLQRKNTEIEAKLREAEARVEKAEKEHCDTLRRHIELFNSLKVYWDRKGSKILSYQCESIKQRERAETAEGALREIEQFVRENDPRHLSHASGILRDIAVKCRRALKDTQHSGDTTGMATDRERRLEVALREAASSLETISKLAGRDEDMGDMMQVRGYANSRATVARAALSTSQTQPQARIE